MGLKQTRSDADSCSSCCDLVKTFRGLNHGPTPQAVVRTASCPAHMCLQSSAVKSTADTADSPTKSEGDSSVMGFQLGNCSQIDL